MNLRGAGNDRNLYNGKQMSEPIEDINPIGGLVLISANQFAVIRVEEVSLELLQELVGGLVERVPLPSDAPIEVVVNEEGILRNLPYNPVASHFYQWCYEFPTNIKLELYGPAVFLTSIADAEGFLNEESVHFLGSFLEKEIFEKYGDD